MTQTPTAETYAELHLAYDTFNRELYGGELPACLLTLQREKRTCGYFSAKRFGHRDGRLTDEIALNPSLFAVVPLIETLATIAHEMCHLWQEHFGDHGRGRYHNAQWGNKLESIGLMPSSTGRPGGKRTGDRMADYPIEGGLFLQVCKRLITEDFRISWHDRFPPSNVASFQETDHSAVQGLPAEAMSVASEEGVSLALPASGRPAALNRSNRTKYTCGCNTNVWAKPGLRIRCDGCGQAFAAEEAAA